MRALLHVDTLVSVDELCQLSRFDIRFKDIHEIQPNTPDGAIAHSLPFVKRSGLLTWELEIVTKPRLKALGAVCDAADAAKAAAEAPTAPSLAARAAPRDAPAAAAASCCHSERKAGKDRAPNPDAEPATVPCCRN